MEQKGFRRKLTAILSADVAGYSRLMQGYEAANVKALEICKQNFSNLIRQRCGKVVDVSWHNLLKGFGLFVDAIQCAVARQKEFQTRRTELPSNRTVRGPS
jgi:adenylate cyclase